MNNKQAIENLKALRTFHNQFVEANKDIENSFSKQLVEALDIAIKALEGTALEVPVQEQLKDNTLLHKLEIKNKTIKLDNFSIKGVTEYEFEKKSFKPGSLANLTVKIKINDFVVET